MVAAAPSADRPDPIGAVRALDLRKGAEGLAGDGHDLFDSELARMNSARRFLGVEFGRARRQRMPETRIIAAVTGAPPLDLIHYPSMKPGFEVFVERPVLRPA